MILSKLFKSIAFALLVIGITSCNKSSTEVELPTLAIGDFHEGGVIFYLDSTGKHGYVCAPPEQSYGCEWGCLPIIVPNVNGVEIGTGAQNTESIVSTCSSLDIAAGICDTLTLNDYEDWFLPSKDELNLIYENQDLINPTALANNGELLQRVNYWSSSHATNNSVWVQYLGSGGSQYSNPEGNRNHVRAIRSF